MTKIRSPLLADIGRSYEYCRGGRVRKLMQLVRLPGVQSVCVYRLGNWLLCQNPLVRVFVEPIYFVLDTLIRIVWGIELPRATKIGPGLYIGHFGGITVSSAAEIGSRCTLSPCITIGVSGEGSKQGVPIIGDNVYVAPGARLIGKIRIGNNVKIGANAVVYKDIPDNAVVVLDPGFKIISIREP